MDLAEFFDRDPDFFVVPAGETIFREGAPADSMYVLLDGTAEIVLAGKVLEKAGRGSLVGEMALIDEGPRTATVRAVTACKLVPIGREAFERYSATTPGFAREVMKIMCDRLRRVNRLLASASQAPAP